jgi:hypothetical protein
MLDGVQIFFENQFVEAQRVFATQDQVNPVYALGSGALAFMKGKLESTKPRSHNCTFSARNHKLLIGHVKGKKGMNTPG